METPADPGALLSIIVPTYNDTGDLKPCLCALRAEAPPGSELIVVVDGPPVEAASAVAAAAGARVFLLDERAGPAAARNYGAAHAHGDIFVFVDADVVVRRGGLARIERAFADDPGLTAMFGSYDDSPRSPGLVSRYRNLLHHFVHQEGRAEATTFWAGLGAVRRAAFLEAGGFDAAGFTRPSVEDIELGYRLRGAGGRIRFDKGLQGTHLKRWSLWSMIRTDVTCRALPWARLVLGTDRVPTELNLRASQRVSAGLVACALVAAVLALQRTVLLSVTVLALLPVALINQRFYRLLWRRGGPGLAATGFLLHLLYFLYSATSFALVWLDMRLRGAGRALGHRRSGPR
jgi:cellulose synthase/poly-beta-1,6-N-acetylglucosamine synthase-like glycosyltransferase